MLCLKTAVTSQLLLLPESVIFFRVMSMLACCPGREDLNVHEASLFCLATTYPETVVSGAQGQAVVDWSAQVTDGVVLFQQKHDYAVLWRSLPVKEAVIYRPSSHLRDDRFSRKLCMCLKERGFRLACWNADISPCQCGALVKKLLGTWLCDQKQMNSIYDSAFKR